MGVGAGVGAGVGVEIIRIKARLYSVPTGLDLDWTGTELGNSATLPHVMILLDSNGNTATIGVMLPNGGDIATQ